MRHPFPTTRRSFLKSTTGAGLLICGSRTAFGFEANQRLNIAAIGIGGQAEGNLNAVSSENFVAFCDVDDRRAANSRKKYPDVKAYYQDFRKMLDEKANGIDAVMVATPDHTHAVAAIASMKLGKHVFCEKPLTRTVYEARMMRLTAQKQKVVTQMGNQGSASEGVRRATEWAMAGTVGPIKEAYLWVGDGNPECKLPEDKPEVPKELAWDLWLGPAAERPYHPSYVPYTWRNWRHFGSGGFGDIGCHTGNFLFRCLKLPELWALSADTPRESRLIKFEGQATGVHAEGYPSSCRVQIHIPARGDQPALKLTASSGVAMRPSKDLTYDVGLGSFGSLLIGTKGSIYSSDPWNTSSMLLPRNNSLEQPPKTLPRGVGHHREWVDACKGNGKTFSPFDIGGPMTEMIQLVNVAAQTGTPFTFDPATGEISDNAQAGALLHRAYRQGWSL